VSAHAERARATTVSTAPEKNGAFPGTFSGARSEMKYPSSHVASAGATMPTRLARAPCTAPCSFAGTRRG